MTFSADTPSGIRRMTETTGDERAALEGMLRAYPVEQLVEEVLVAWQELADRNEDLVTSKQRLRVLELDLAERKDEVAPEVAQLKAAENDLEEAGTRIVHLERLLEDARKELVDNNSSISVEEREALEREAAQLRDLTTQQDDVIAEMEGRMGQMIEALERAANAGLTSVTADEVRALKAQADALSADLDAEKAANDSLEEERQRLRDIADRLRGLLDARDKRLAELEEQLERVMQGPRSVSAEHDYLVEQIEELKRRLLERNREYESLRRRERRLHNDVFERDERIQQMSLTIGDLEAALTDRTSELRELESQRDVAVNQLDGVKRSERTREVVGRVFADSLSLVRSHDERELRKEIYSNSPDVERTISAPTTDDMQTLADGGSVDLDTALEVIEKGMDVPKEARPESPGGTGDPVLYEDED
jgi:chromosome segregation ATPase